MAAALTHNVSNERLKKIGETIPSVAIVTGDEDHLIKTKMSRTIKDAMPDAEFVEWKNTGHSIQAQRPREFNTLVERTILK
jgi:pimeloyl-ACP methyl ester carboxylesterase